MRQLFIFFLVSFLGSASPTWAQPGKVLKFDKTGRQVLLQCKGSCEAAVSDEVTVKWRAKGTTQSFTMKVRRVAGRGGKMIGRVERLGKGTRKLPRPGTMVGMKVTSAAVTEEPQTPPEAPTAQEMSSEPEEPVHTTAEESRPVGLGQFWDSKPPHQLEVGGGTRYDSFFELLFLDVRAQLAFFNFPLYIEVGLTPYFVQYSLVSGGSGWEMGMGMPFALRYDARLDSWLRVGVYAGAEIGLFLYRKLDGPSTLTSGSDFYTGIEGDFGGVVTFDMTQSFGLYARGGWKRVSAGMVFIF
jgi:hypothetical protein